MAALTLSRSALAGRLQSVQRSAQKNGQMVTDAAEQGVSMATAYGIGQAEGRGLADSSSMALPAGIAGAGIVGQLFAPNGVVRSVARGARRAALDVIAYKAGVKSGLETATAPKS